MTYALIVFATPKHAGAEEVRYRSLRDAIETDLENIPKDQILAENCLWLNLDTEMHVLSHIVAEAKTHNFQCRTLFSDKPFSFAVS